MNDTVFTVKLAPKAAKNAVHGWADDGRGGKILKASVTAAPEKGKANKALIELLSREYKVPKSSISIISGETCKLKTLKITGAFPGISQAN